MPSIDTFESKKTNKKFKKIAYRPWNVIEPISDKESPFNPQKILTKTSLNKQESISNQLVTNQIPIGNQLVINQEPISNQLDTDQIPISNQLAINQEPISNQISNQLVTKKVHFKEEWSQEKTSYELQKLCGLQKKILIYIITNCMGNDDLVSHSIYTNDIKTWLATNSNTIKTAIQRLIKKNFIIREEGKSGVGGFSSFRIQKFLKQIILKEIKSFSISNQLVTNQEPISNPISNQPNSSSSNIITTTNAEDSKKNILDEEWDSIDIEPLTDIGFTKSHLFQISKLKSLDSKIVQDSINAFAFDLKQNDKQKNLRTSALNYFMGIMKKGMPYAPPENYESPEEIALKNYVSRKIYQQKKLEELEKKAFNLAFEEWLSQITEEEVAQIIPNINHRKHDSPFRNGSLNIHFRDNYWKEIKKQI